MAHGLLVRENIREERVALINFAEAVISEGLEIIPHRRIQRRVLCRTAAQHELRDSEAADGQGGIAERYGARARIDNQSVLRGAALIVGIREKFI